MCDFQANDRLVRGIGYGVLFSVVLWLATIMLLVALSGCAGYGIERPPVRTGPRYGQVYYNTLDKDPTAIVQQCHFPVMVALADTYPASYSDLVSSTVDYWNQALDQNVFFYMGDSPQYRADDLEAGAILLVSAKEDIGSAGLYVAHSTITDKETNRTCAGVQRIYLQHKDLANEYYALSILRHEFGHALGLDHSSDKRLLMFPSMSSVLDRARYAQPCELKAVVNLYNWPQRKIDCGCGVAP